MCIDNVINEVIDEIKFKTAELGKQVRYLDTLIARKNQRISTRMAALSAPKICCTKLPSKEQTIKIFGDVK